MLLPDRPIVAPNGGEEEAAVVERMFKEVKVINRVRDPLWSQLPTAAFVVENLVHPDGDLAVDVVYPLHELRHIMVPLVKLL